MASPASIILEPGLHADRPAASIAGRLYYETDTKKMFRDNGSAWADVEADTSGGGGGGGTFSGVACVTPGQLLSGSTRTEIDLGSSALFDTDGYFVPGTSQFRLVIPTGLGGRFLITANAAFDHFSADTNVFLDVVLNPDTDYIFMASGWQSWVVIGITDYPRISLAQIIALADGDQIALVGANDLGGTHYVNKVDVGSPTLSLARLG